MQYYNFTTVHINSSFPQYIQQSLSLHTTTVSFWSIGDGTIWRQLVGNSNDSLDTNGWTRQMDRTSILLQHNYSSAQHALLLQFIQILHQHYRRISETNHNIGQLRITEFYNHITAWAEIAMHNNFHNSTICIIASTAWGTRSLIHCPFTPSELLPAC